MNYSYKLSAMCIFCYLTHQAHSTYFSKNLSLIFDTCFVKTFRNFKGLWNTYFSVKSNQ